MHDDPTLALHAKLERYSDIENWDAAEQCASEILSLDPHDLGAHVTRAVALRALDRAQEAWPHIEACLSLAPENAIGHRHAARYFADKKRWRTAFKHLDTALSLDPDDPDTLFLAALLNAEKRRFQESEGLRRKGRCKSLR